MQQVYFYSAAISFYLEVLYWIPNFLASLRPKRSDFLDARCNKVLHTWIFFNVLYDTIISMNNEGLVIAVYKLQNCAFRSNYQQQQLCPSASKLSKADLVEEKVGLFTRFFTVSKLFTEYKIFFWRFTCIFKCHFTRKTCSKLTRVLSKIQCCKLSMT